jgi:hypothetical protein
MPARRIAIGVFNWCDASAEKRAVAQNSLSRANVAFSTFIKPPIHPPTLRSNAFIESFSRNALGCAPNIFNRCQGNRSDTNCQRRSEQNDWYHNDKTASNFPTELLDILQIRADGVV